MKTIFLTLLLVLPTLAADAQELYSDARAQMSFTGKGPLEEITAESRKAQVILNKATGDIAVKVPITSFEFSNKLQQEHFNEKYMESDKYPFATFTGKLTNPDVLAQPGEHTVAARGKFTVHGVTQERDLTGKLTQTPDGYTLTTDFKVALADHKIERPQIVLLKVAETFTVSATANLRPRQK